MRYVGVFVTSLVCALPFPQTSGAQNSPSPRPLARGDHVRIAALGDTGATVGRVVTLDSAQLTVAPDDSGSIPRTIPLARLSELSIQRDARTRTTAAEVGALVGLVAGGSYYYFGLCHQDPSGCTDEQRRATHAAEYDRTYVTVGDLLAIGGFVAGGLLGYALAPAPHWEILATPIVRRDDDGEPHTALRIGLARALRGR